MSKYTVAIEQDGERQSAVDVNVDMSEAQLYNVLIGALVDKGYLSCDWCLTMVPGTSLVPWAREGRVGADWVCVLCHEKKRDQERTADHGNE